MNRREFVSAAALSPVALSAQVSVDELKPSGTLGNLKEGGKADTGLGSWYTAEKEGDGLVFRFPAGTLAKAKYVTTDMLIDGDRTVAFAIRLQEGEKGRAFRFGFGGLNQCSFRVRMSLALVDQNRWMVDREGAFLKPACGGDRVDLDKVDRMTLVVSRKSSGPARWCMTPIRAAAEDVPKLAKPILPKGPLLDELGQSTLKTWPGKTANVTELKRRIQLQLENAPKQAWPEEFSRWGGWKAKRLEKGSGFFRTHNDGKRWWLVDPDGYAFWSAGLDCVRVDAPARYDGIESALSWVPDRQGEFREIFEGGRGNRGGQSINYLAANFIRSLGREGWRDNWAKVALSEMKRLRFNTVGNWSEWEFASKARFPYVRPMQFSGRRAGMAYRDFPDVFHPDFAKDAAAYASQLTETAKDPALIGYFLMNEPTWGFSSEVPAAGMLYVTETCASRIALARELKRKYSEDAKLAATWKRPASFEQIEKGRWTGVLTPEAISDLREFSVIMVERYFRELSSACKAVDPNHLNLGMRWAGLPPAWAVQGMKFFDVFSLNCYRETLPRDQAEKIHAMLKMPVMVGEWHFGALDAGLPSSGIGHLKNQVDRAKAYRVYLEDAAVNPYCVGVHWFTLYDQSALGRFDGENYNIGFLDICNRPYEELSRGAILSHERMYQIADGRAAAFNDVPEYLPKLFF